MFNFVEFRDLENIAGIEGNHFLGILKSKIEEFGIDYGIRALIASGICVDNYGTGKYKKLYQESLKILRLYCEENDKRISSIENSVTLFEILFTQFRNLRQISKAESVPIENQIPAFLITTEILLGSLIEYSKGNSFEEISERYPSFFGPFFENGNLAKPSEVFSQLNTVFDEISENTGIILKYLIFNKAPLIGLETEITLDHIQISRAHIFLFPLYELILRNYEQWRYWGGTISKISDNEILFEPDKERLLSNLLSAGRSRFLRMGYMVNFAHISDKVECVPDSKILPPIQFRLSGEILDCIFCNDIFSSEDLGEQIAGVSLAQWIRAYTILHQEANNIINNRDKIKPYTLTDWCIIKTRENWIQTIVLGGIPTTIAALIVDTLTFNLESKDLYDCPLIPIDGYLVSLPTIVSNASSSESYLSNFSNKNLDISFKGKGLEKRIRRKLTERNILNSRIYTKNDNDEYECDIVFVLENEMYFVECKTILQPQSSRSHYEFVDKISNSTIQLNRIVNFYLENFDKVREELNLDQHWEPSKVNKLIISSALIGESIEFNDCSVVDISIITRFLNRKPPGIVMGKKIIYSNDKNYTGDITPEKLNNVISNPPPVDIAKGKYTEKITKIELPEIVFSFIDYEKGPDIIFSADKEKEIMEHIGLTKEQLDDQ